MKYKEMFVDFNDVRDIQLLTYILMGINSKPNTIDD